MTSRWSLIGVALLATSWGSTARELASPKEARHKFTAVDLVRVRDIGGFDSSLFGLPSPLAVSPDGSAVAFVVTAADEIKNTYRRSLIVASLNRNGEQRTLDEGGELPISRFELRGIMVESGYPDTVTPRWTPDGKTIGYLRRDDGVTQLWVVDVNGGTARPITKGGADIEQWAWLSDAEAIVASRSGKIRAVASIDQQGRRGWRYDALWEPNVAPRPQIPGNIPLTYGIVNVRTGGFRAARPDDAAQIEFSNQVDPSNVGAVRGPDGSIAWVEPDTPAPLAPERLRLRNHSGQTAVCSEPQCLGGIVAIFPQVHAHGVTFQRREGWNKETTAFYEWRPGARRIRPLWRTEDVITGCVPRAGRLVCLRETSVQPRRVEEIEPATGRSRIVFDPNPGFASFRLGRVERLRWVNDRGLPAWGDLVLPPGHRNGRKLPLIVVQYHSDGFLRGGTGNEYPIFPLAAQGFAVLSVERPPSVATTVSGLRNWDDVLSAEIRDWSERSSLLSSVLTGVEKVIAMGIADPARIGLTGVSDGSSTARFALINSHVFSAVAISQASLEPKTAMTYGGPAWADFNRSLGYPPASAPDPKFWQRFSLASAADRIDVPILLQVSDDEYLLALETFTALRENGRPVDMYVFPDERHVKWQPEHRLAVFERTIDWFNFWFQRQIDPNPSKGEQYAVWSTMLKKKGDHARDASPSSP